MTGEVTHRSGRRAADVAGLALVVLGCVCLVAGVVAGYVNRALLGGDRFADAVDQLRREPAVSAALGRSLTDELLKRQPDLVAVRPLVDAVATSVAGSDLLSGPTRAAAASFQRSVTEPSARSVVLRIADAGAVVTAALQRVSTGSAVRASPEVSLRLAAIGNQSFAGRTIMLARYVRAAAWLLPVTGVLLVAGGVLLSRRRRRAVLVAGIALLALAGLVAVLLLLGGTWAGEQDDTTLRGALIHHGWDVAVTPLWWSVLAVAAAGLLVTASAAALLPDVDPTALLRRAWAVVTRAPSGDVARVVRAAAAVALGIGVFARPSVALAGAGLLTGIWLVLYGVHELAETTSRQPSQADGTVSDLSPVGAPRARARVGLPVGAAAVAVLVVLVTWGALPSTAASAAPAGAVAGTGEVCNGYAALCDRRYPDVAYAATHNAMSDATDPSWFIPEQGRSLTGQLDAGVRALLVDVWPGAPTTRGRVATARSAYADAKAQLEREFGPEVVAAGLRVVDAVADPTPAGPEALYLCHGLCELGATAFRPAVESVRIWLDTHPDEVLTLIVEDHVSAARIGADLDAAGLGAYAATPPVPGAPWPTLREMITSGRRLYVLLEGGDGGADRPWLANAYQRLVQETPYTAPTVADLATCRPNRGPADAPLLLMNHWLSGFGQLVSAARKANADAVLGTRARVCRQERRLPNFVAVNYADIGDIDSVVRQQNGVG